MKPKVSLVFLNYNGKEDTLDFLKSVYASDCPKKAMEIIMVDNGSTDDSVKEVKENHPRVKVIKLKENLNIATARNIGLKNATGRYILSSDNDIALAQDYLGTLVDLMEGNPNTGIIGGLIYKKRPKTKIESTGYGFNFLTGNLYDITDSGQEIQEREYLSGCAMLIRKKVVEEIGFFDEALYFFEDADLCFRARKAGFKVIFTHETRVFHGKSKTTPYHPKGKYINWCRSLFYFIFKHSPFFLVPFLILLHLTIIPILRAFVALDPTIKVSLFEDYKIRFSALAWNLTQHA